MCAFLLDGEALSDNLAIYGYPAQKKWLRAAAPALATVRRKATTPGTRTRPVESTVDRSFSLVGFSGIALPVIPFVIYN